MFFHKLSLKSFGLELHSGSVHLFFLNINMGGRQKANDEPELLSVCMCVCVCTLVLLGIEFRALGMLGNYSVAEPCHSPSLGDSR